MTGETREMEAGPSVTISPAMRALFAEMKARLSPDDAPGPVATAAARPEPLTGAPRSAAPGAAPIVSLRRDGARPLRFRGAPILRRDRLAGEGGMRFSLALYLSDAGEVIAAAAARPEDGRDAAEVHVAEALAEPDSLPRLLARFAPEDALPEPAAASPDSAERFADARWAIRQDFEAFSASVRRLAPPDRRTRT